MLDPRPTAGELFKARAVTDDQVNAAVDAYLASDSVSTYEIAPGLTVDLSEAIERHGPTRKALADAGSSETFRRTMVRTAILLSQTIGA